MQILTSPILFFVQRMNSKLERVFFRNFYYKMAGHDTGFSV